MVRFVAFNAVFFLLPFAVYAAWLVATRGSANNAGDWTGRTIAYLAVGGAVLMSVALLFFINFQGAPPGGKYTPATVEDGKIVPGHID
jgi:hypothetical protein